MLMEEKKQRNEIRKLTEAARDQDYVDDHAFGLDCRGDELPQELANRKTRLKTIQAAKKRLEERKVAEAAAKRAAEQKDCGGKKGEAAERVLPQPRDQENFTAPDSRIMPTGGRTSVQVSRPRSGFTTHRRLRPAPAADGFVANAPRNPPIPP